MSRLRRIADRDRFFFVTTNLAAQVAPLEPTERDLILVQLRRQHAETDFFLFGYVIMPTHLHLLLAPRKLGLAACMRNLKRHTALQITSRRGRRGALWQARYFDFILRRAGDFWDKLQYIHDNPAEAGLVRVSTEWPWSSAAHYRGSAGSQTEIDRFDLPADRNAPIVQAPGH